MKMFIRLLHDYLHFEVELQRDPLLLKILSYSITFELRIEREHLLIRNKTDEKTHLTGYICSVEQNKPLMC